MLLPSDIQDNVWEERNLRQWSFPKVRSLPDVQLLPLEAKALHVIGTLVQVSDSVGYLLYCGPKKRPYADYYLYAYLLACTAIELLGRCQTGEMDPNRSTLRSGFERVGLKAVHVNVKRNGIWTVYTYDVAKLVALRNLAAHGQALSSTSGKPEPVFLHVELLDSFPVNLMTAFDSYYESVFESADPTARRDLAMSAVEPVLYSDESGQVYASPMNDAYERIYQPHSRPSRVLKYRDWQVYNPERDKQPWLMLNHHNAPNVGYHPRAKPN